MTTFNKFTIGHNERDLILKLLEPNACTIHSPHEDFVANQVKQEIREKLQSVIDKGGYHS